MRAGNQTTHLPTPPPPLSTHNLQPTTRPDPGTYEKEEQTKRQIMHAELVETVGLKEKYANAQAELDAMLEGLKNMDFAEAAKKDEEERQELFSTLAEMRAEKAAMQQYIDRLPQVGR